MIHRLIPLAVVQSMMLASGQVLLKFGLGRMRPFAWSAEFWRSVFLNWQFAMSGICFATGCALWLYIIKHFPFSMAYPMASLSYVFGMVAAMVFFHENVNAAKWVGVCFIVTGCVLIAR